MQGKGLTAPALPAFPGRELNDQARGRAVPVAKNSTPLRGLIFSKSRVHGYGQILGKADQLIENLNLIKIWQHGLKRFISSRVIRGSALVEMSGVR